MPATEPALGSGILSSPESNSSIKKVIFADFAIVKFGTVIQALKKDNVVTEAVTDQPKFLSLISEGWFDAAILNLVLGGVGPVELISNVRRASKNPEIKIIVISRQVQKANIQNAIRAGASDFVAEPFEAENLYKRIQYHLTPKKILEPRGYESSLASEHCIPYLNVMLEATENFSHTDRGHDHGTYYKTLCDIAKLLDSNRASLIIVDFESSGGMVLASSDDPKFSDFAVDLNKYPEILHVMYSGHFVMIGDVSQNTLTQNIGDTVRSISIGSLMVFPVRFQNDVTGVLTIRRAKAAELPGLDVMRVLQAIANTMAAHAYTRALLRRIYKDYSTKPGAPVPEGEKQ